VIRSESGCPQNRSGKGLSVQEQHLLIIGEKTNRTATPGTRAMLPRKPMLWVRRSQIHGDFMIWPEMSGNGPKVIMSEVERWPGEDHGEMEREA